MPFFESFALYSTATERVGQNCSDQTNPVMIWSSTTEFNLLWRVPYWRSKPVHVCALGICYNIILNICNYNDENINHERDNYVFVHYENKIKSSVS